MKTLGALSACAVVIGALIVACVGDDPAVSDGTDGGLDPQGCTPAQKSCNGSCVSKDDPNAGCAGAACTPCAGGVNAAASCKAGACSTTCNTGFSDCDGDPATGCEAKTGADVSNCGACGKVCGSANTDTPTKCESSKCVFACKKDFGHCGTADDLGCETDLLTNALHCGACGHSCAGGTCLAGKCQPFQLASASFPSGVAVDAKDVYFTFPSVPAIQKVQRDGKCTPAAPCPKDFAGSGVGDPLAQIRGPSPIVSDGTSVFWTNQAQGTIGKRAVAGGPIVNFGPAQSPEPGYLVLAGGKIWWTSGFVSGANTAHVTKANLDGTGITTVANYSAPAATFIGVGGIAADATHVYWASEKSGVYRAAFADGPCNEGSGAGACASFGSASSPSGIAVDAQFVYWTETTGTIKRAPKAGGQSVAIATGQDSPKAIAVLGTFVYWGNSAAAGPTAGTIRRAPQVAATCDGAACELVATVAQPDAIVAADDGIYWTNNTVTGGVYRLAK
ncbi:hypothetical protein BH11MYX4_BH11MYX4_24460 [soil metagenome]